MKRRENIMVSLKFFNIFISKLKYYKRRERYILKDFQNHLPQFYSVSLTSCSQLALHAIFTFPVSGLFYANLCTIPTIG